MGLAAVEKTAILKPDLVILDLSMPRLNGLQAAHTIHAADPRIPLLLFTLESIEGPLEEQARRAGFRGALSKGEGIFALSQLSRNCFRVRLSFLQLQQRCRQRTQTMISRVRPKNSRRS